MERIRMTDGRVIVPDEAQCLLPAVISKEFLDAVFACGYDDDGHVHRVHEKLPWAEKTRFEAACTAFGEEYQALWAQAAIAWASVLNPNNKWDPWMFTWCYLEPFQTWLIKDIRLTETGVWFITTTHDQLMTFDEFLYEYGVTLQDHLEGKLAFDKQVVTKLIKVIGDEMVAKEVVLGYPDGTIGHVVRVGPATVDPKHWQYKKGEEFIQEYDPST